MVRYSLDIDGVVADYFTARAAAAKTLGIRPLSQPVGMKPEDLDAFMQDRMAAINAAMKEYISAHLEEFFGGLDCLASQEDRSAIHRAAAQGSELFWVSARSYFGGHSFGEQYAAELPRITLEWLLKNDLPADAAHVVLTPDKAAVVRKHNIRFHLDDNVAHVTSVALQSTAKVFILRRPWNQRFVVVHPNEPDANYATSAGAYGVEEVDSIAEFITLMGAGA